MTSCNPALPLTPTLSHNSTLSTPRYDDAEPLLQQALKGRTKVLGTQHPDTLLSMANLAGFYFKARGRYKEAEELYRKSQVWSDDRLWPTEI